MVLKDNSSGGSANNGGGGATWAFEVSGQTMICPIRVEDLNPPGQMLIEVYRISRRIFYYLLLENMFIYESEVEPF